jgi:hypothetical protein
MAKAQSFADKVHKKSGGPTIKVVRLVYPYKSPENGSWRFTDKFVKINPDEDENKVIEATIQNGRARLEKI